MVITEPSIANVTGRRKAAALLLRATTAATPGGSLGITYTDDVAEWFDMGLVSKLGKEEADAR